MDKRGLSPVIATVLLIALVITIGLVVFIWIKSMTQEAVTKFDGENIKLVCNDVAFQASYSGDTDTLFISNSGNVPIFSMKVVDYGDGSHQTQDLRDASVGWPVAGLNQGGTFSSVMSFTGNEIVLVPVLIGDSNSGKKTYVCDETQNGYSIQI